MHGDDGEVCVVAAPACSADSELYRLVGNHDAKHAVGYCILTDVDVESRRMGLHPALRW